MKHGVNYLVLTFIMVTISAHSNTAKELTMNDAVQEAIRNNPDVKSWDYAIQARKSGAHAAIAEYYPTITLGSTLSKEKNLKNLSSTTSLNADQLIYSFAGPLQQYKKAKNISAISEMDKVMQQNRIRLETEKAFLQAWLVQEQEKTIASLKASATKTFKQQQHKNKLKQLDKSTWLNDAMIYSDQLVEVEQYHENLLIAYKKLEFFMGESLAVTHLSWEGTKDHDIRPLDAYYRHALTWRPEITRATKRMDVQKWNVKLAHGQRLPMITANANTGFVVTPRGEAATFIPTPVPEILASDRGSRGSTQGFWSLNLSVKWSLFDGLVTQHQERQAEAERLKEMLERDGVILNIKQEVHEAYFNLSKAIKQQQAQKIHYVRHDNEFKLMQQKLKLGRISDIDMDTATTAWQKAQLDWLACNIAIALAERHLMHACGYPDAL